MTALLARIVLVLGFCAATVGAAGFAETIESEAWPLLLGGLALVIGGGLVLKRETRRAAEDGHGGPIGRAGLSAALSELQRELSALVAEREALGEGALCQRIDALLSGPYFELGARNEDYARVLGPSAYARIWEGFAISERLLARAWSIATDGRRELALEELPRALRSLEQALGQAQTD